MEFHDAMCSKRSKCSLVMLYGIPGVGKTSLLEKLFETSSNDFTFFRVSFDKIERFFRNDQQIIQRLNTHNILLKELESMLVERRANKNLSLNETLLFERLTQHLEITKSTNLSFVPLIWKKSRTVAYMITKEIVKLITSNDLTEPFIIFLEDNFLLKSMRKPYYRLAGEFNLGYCQLSVQADLDICIKRNSMRSLEENVPEEKVKEAQRKCEKSVCLKNEIEFWNNEEELEETKVKDLWISIEKVLNEVEISSKEEEDMREKNKLLEGNQMNFVHCLDLKIRELIGILFGSKIPIDEKMQKKMNSIIKVNNLKEEVFRMNALFFSCYKALILDITSVLYDQTMKKKKRDTNIAEICVQEYEKITKIHSKMIQKLPQKLDVAKSKGVKSFIEEIYNYWDLLIQDLIAFDSQSVIQKLAIFWAGFTVGLLNLCLKA